MANSKISAFTTQPTATLEDNQWLVVSDTGVPETFKAAPSSVGALSLLESGSAVTTSSNLDIDLTPYTAYGSLMWFFSGVTNDTDDKNIIITFSDDGGATFEVGAADYDYEYNWQLSAGTEGYQANDAFTGILFVGSMGNDAGAAFGGVLWMYDWQSTANWCNVNWNVNNYHSSGTHGSAQGGGQFNQTDDVTDIRFTIGGGELDGGTYALYGMRGV